MLNHAVETVVMPSGKREQLSGEELTGERLSLPGVAHLRRFRLEAGLPVWEFSIGGGAVLEKRVVMPHRQNTVVLRYKMLEPDAENQLAPIKLELRPAVHFRHHEEELSTTLQPHYRYTLGDMHEVTCDGAPCSLKLQLHGGDDSGFHQQPRALSELHYRMEAVRGYRNEGKLWSPGVLMTTLTGVGSTAALVASTEETEIMEALTPEEAIAAELERRARLLREAPMAAQSGVAAELVLAADQFVIAPSSRRRDAARALAEGDEIRSVIAGYHWFTDWGRDTMISLEGLTLCTGRAREAGSILRTFAHYVQDGLLPNMFPDGANEGLYNTADATLWFFHALDRYYRTTNDQALLSRLLPTMLDIANHHIKGTRFNIRVDSNDGLLSQGEEGFALTWMDAKWDNWVVTPRRGKAVEINALWYNALCCLASWFKETGDLEASGEWKARAEKVRESFNSKFWNEELGYLCDLVEPPSSSSATNNSDDSDAGQECRPNQIFAISLPNPVLDQKHWQPVLETVESRLLTPVGLRSLAPGSEHYAPRYFGNLRERDSAYHQGTVWGWLIGPFFDAYLKLYPSNLVQAREVLKGSVNQLSEFGMGSLAEVFDAETPYTPRGCVAQAWSVAELLRTVLLVGGVVEGGQGEVVGEARLDSC